MRLEGKSVIVTGGGSGFGEGMARRFVEEGAKVLVVDLNGDTANRVADELGDNAVAFEADVTKFDQVQGFVDEAVSRFGKLDCLINNAGYSARNKWLCDVSEDEFDMMVAVNAKALYLAAKAAVPALKENGGSIITTASTAGLRPRPGLTWYNATKGFAITATKSMAVELAPHNIRVNCLCPVAGDTGMLHLFLGEDTPERREQFKATVPLGRLSTPRDIANAALWLASDDAEFITGVALEVDGGRCI